MSDRRNPTERHYETPFEHLDREEHAEKAMLGWALRSIHDIGEAINALFVNQEAQAETSADILATQRTISRHLAAIERKLTGQSPEDQAALEAAMAELSAADHIIDRIEPDTGKGTS